MQHPKQKVYKKVFDTAREELLRSELHSRCKAAGVSYDFSPIQSRIEIPFFKELISLTIPDFTFKSSTDANITLVSKIILLHYLIKASGTSPIGELIPYEDIPGLRHYFPVFEKRVLKPLQSAFGNDRSAFREAGVSLGGFTQEYGDSSFTVHALPRVPVTFILWEGDEEFPPLVRTLFDPTISEYLPLEDIAVVSKLAATRILKEARKRYAEELSYDL
jgi:hypothetical protein